jgi:hypothetical protein
MRRRRMVWMAILAVAMLMAGCGSRGQEPDRPEGAGQWVLQTKNVTRVNEDDPVKAAVLISRMIWPSTDAQNRPGTVLIAEDGKTKLNLPSVTLVHHPNNGPLLYAKKDQIPQETLDEIKRLQPAGSSMNQGTQVIMIGSFAPKAKKQITDAGYKVDVIHGEDPAEMARQLDAYYAKVNGGEYPKNVIVGSVDRLDYTLPAAGWIAHMPEPLLYVSKDAVPEATRQALQQRKGQAKIYLLGPEQVISPKVEKELQSYGEVVRIAGDVPEENAIAFAKFKDEKTGFGWGVTEPGHGLTFVKSGSLDTAIASASFAHLGKHAPMLVLEGNDLSAALQQYLTSLQPGYEKEPTEGPYNHAYLIGSEKSVPFAVQGKIDRLLEIVPKSGGSGHEEHMPMQGNNGHGEHMGHH